MKVIYEGEEIAEVPDCMAAGDTLIIEDVVYEVSTKTFDLDNNDLYCKVEMVEEEQPIKLASELLSWLYRSPYMVTSGPNTNDIENNPRLLGVMSTAAAVIDEETFRRDGLLYRTNIIKHWNDKHISWDTIFEDTPARNHSHEQILRECKILLELRKITQEVWPETVKQMM